MRQFLLLKAHSRLSESLKKTRLLKVRRKWVWVRNIEQGAEWQDFVLDQVGRSLIDECNKR